MGENQQKNRYLLSPKALDNHGFTVSFIPVFKDQVVTMLFMLLLSIKKIQTVSKVIL